MKYAISTSRIHYGGTAVIIMKHYYAKRLVVLVLIQRLVPSSHCPSTYKVRTTRICTPYALGHLPSTLPLIPAALHDIRSNYMAGWQNKRERCINPITLRLFSVHHIPLPATAPSADLRKRIDWPRQSSAVRVRSNHLAADPGCSGQRSLYPEGRQIKCAKLRSS